MTRLRPLSLTLVFSLILFSRLWGLTSQSLWLDEGSTWQITHSSWPTLFAELFSPKSAYPLYHLLLKGWIAIVGDSEFALRFPSALAGALAVIATFFTAQELSRNEGSPSPSKQSNYSFIAALLLFLSPFAWEYAQEAKVYSLLLLLSLLFIWSFSRALRQNSPRSWIIWGIIALLSVNTHRLAIFLLLAALAMKLSLHSFLTTFLAKAAPKASFRAIRGNETLAESPALAGAQQLKLLIPMENKLGFILEKKVKCSLILLLGGIAVGWLGWAVSSVAFPLVLWRTFIRFSVDRNPGEILWPLLLPFGILLAWGLITIARAAWQRSGFFSPARLLLSFFFIPLVCFLLFLYFIPTYEARYLIIIYPAWILILASPSLFLSPGRKSYAYGLTIAATLAVSSFSLYQPRLGLFSGSPFKEQYREAIHTLANQAHPDDLIILHPAYIRPLYDYYFPRFTTDPSPKVLTFADFKLGQKDFTKREWDTTRKRLFADASRSFLLIAPEHAKVVDPPPLPGDKYGWVGLYYQYSREEKKWACGIWKYSGVDLYCQASPEAYETGVILTPTVKVEALFSNTIRLNGYTLKATTSAGRGVYQAGGTLPLSLFWEVLTQPKADYNEFLHLCQNCNLPPVASSDGPPLEGYLPTSTWLPKKPAREERTLYLPRTLAPGRYSLLLGFYQPDDPSPTSRLNVQGRNVLDHNRLFLGTIEVVAPQ